MKSELLSFKYKDLQLVSLSSNEDLKNLGWRIRKRYLRHADGAETKAALKKFSDAAVDEGRFDLETVGPVQDALLQAQKWRYDKVALSIDPPHRKSWDICEGMCLALKSSASVGSKFLSNTGYVPNGFSQELTMNDFARAIIIEIVKGVTQTAVSPVLLKKAKNSDRDFIMTLQSSYPEFKELEILSESLDVFDSLEMFGISLETTEGVLPPVEEPNQNTEQSIVVAFQNMARDRLINISTFGEVTRIEVNENNAFVRVMRESPETEAIFLNFISAYSDAMLFRCALEDQMKDFTSYLALSLNRRFETIAA